MPVNNPKDNKNFFSKIKTSRIAKCFRHASEYLLSEPARYLRFKSTSARKLYLPLVLAILILSVTFFLNSFYAKNFKGSEEDVKIKIVQGLNFSDVADILEENGIIINRFSFELTAKLLQKENRILPGKYIFKEPLSNIKILNILTDPSLVQIVTFRVPEGVTLRRLSQIAKRNLDIEPEDFFRAASDPEQIERLGLKDKVDNLEGFLFPDTYRVSINISENDLVRLLVSSFERRVFNNELISEQLKNNPGKLLSTVTMASIIEAETYIPEEMPVISGVYHNRLRRRMRLEADPTVQYALPDGPKQRLLYEDLRIESPYNTYRNFGLPPGPINNPGLAAIIAAVQPSEHNYLFFVATGEGGHKFSENYSKHLEAVREYRQRMREKRNEVDE